MALGRSWDLEHGIRLRVLDMNRPVDVFGEVVPLQLFKGRLDLILRLQSRKPSSCITIIITSARGLEQLHIAGILLVGKGVSLEEATHLRVLVKVLVERVQFQVDVGNLREEVGNIGRLLAFQFDQTAQGDAFADQHFLGEDLLLVNTGKSKESELVKNPENKEKEMKMEKEKKKKEMEKEEMEKE